MTPSQQCQSTEGNCLLVYLLITEGQRSSRARAVSIVACSLANLELELRWDKTAYFECAENFVIIKMLKYSNQLKFDTVGTFCYCYLWWRCTIDHCTLMHFTWHRVNLVFCSRMFVYLLQSMHDNSFHAVSCSIFVNLEVAGLERLANSSICVLIVTKDW